MNIDDEPSEDVARTIQLILEQVDKINSSSPQNIFQISAANQLKDILNTAFKKANNYNKKISFKMIIKAITSFKGLIDVPTLLVLFLLKIMMKLLKIIIKIPVMLFKK
ncbi:hypothetical protein HF863_05830 [Lactobacillus agilis]|uniref:Uncharacterized protein n=1 Tax=Ligilactobacillus agilis TaxID=1601 RepID=A0A848C4D8_9LACO|nr:hypothetical protein [Ligilactobacillus agilis]MCI5762094.1 hypothetical protein [Ligilactobacillus agilis]NME42283.1 hypothetical protein [Ligilactobacillus agilis]